MKIRRKPQNLWEFCMKVFLDPHFPRVTVSMKYTDKTHIHN